MAFFNAWDFRDQMSVSPGEQSNCQYGTNIREVKKKKKKPSRISCRSHRNRVPNSFAYGHSRT